MADARALLRAHRAEHRIKHPHAAYSDAGKLLCKLCHEPVKAESLWENHIRGPSHRKRAQLQTTAQAQPIPTSTTEQSSNKESGTGGGKRKLDEVDEGQSSASDSASEDAARKKRSRPSASGQTPPVVHGRRASNTPVQGVEIAIPSRPATPAAGSNSATSTPKGLPVGRSPLIGSEAQMGTPMSISTPTSTPTTAAMNMGNLPISTQALAGPSTTAAISTTSDNNNNSTAQAPANAVDEAEWAAFEAEIATAESESASANPNPYDSSTVISAPALSAAQLAAKSAEEEHERRTHLLNAQIADEREDATLALEAEFAEMEELESRVRRLKERREQLRKGSVANVRAAAGAGAGDDSDVSMTKSPAISGGGASGGKENERAGATEEEEEEEDDDEDEDDWDNFGFR
ncbi:hypothetical protein F5B19DRAFT_288565 [Rostrohypoxylon terebratum]|nr:hypothetical protein F5B19DRAFT_288565 [Rostrohypoxylon terebratum]